MKSCPCGSQKLYTDCCGPFLEGKMKPPTAQALMRSRYTAYTKLDTAYLVQSWHPTTRPHPEQLGLNQTVSWTGLDIVSFEGGGQGDEQGVVEFIARYESRGSEQVLHERSRFARFEGAWMYVDGENRSAGSTTSVKIGRNAPCRCGSGKKYKRCCLGKK